jgi:hypothetical protein
MVLWEMNTYYSFPLRLKKKMKNIIRISNIKYFDGVGIVPGTEFPILFEIPDWLLELLELEFCRCKLEAKLIFLLFVLILVLFGEGLP